MMVCEEFAYFVDDKRTPNRDAPWFCDGWLGLLTGSHLRQGCFWFGSSFASTTSTEADLGPLVTLGHRLRPRGNFTKDGARVSIA
jgi:hypothetical protein